MVKLGALPETRRVIAMFSGGKESLCLLDVLVQNYPEVVPVYRYFLRGMDHTEMLREYTKRRYRLELVTVQDPVLLDLVKEGTFRRFERPHIKLMAFEELEDILRVQTGASWIGYGLRANDSLERNAMLRSSWPYGLNVSRRKFAPLHDWSIVDVRNYVKQRDIPVPPTHSGKEQDHSGVGLKPDEMRWLRDNWPADYERVLRAFPLAIGQADKDADIRQAERERDLRVRGKV